MNSLIDYLIFPGFLFSAIVGLLAGWVDRKVTARIQWRVGPPWYQNFMDIAKLLIKETILPEGARFTFLIAPYLGLMSIILVTTLVGRALLPAHEGFTADLIVILYLLLIPAISMMIGASASGNPFASVGASREMKMVLSYELPFLLAVITVIVKSAGALSLSSIVGFQMQNASNAASISGFLAFIVCILCMQAKLGFVPFDAPEAEQELMAGTCIEYSGLPLAMFKLTKAVLLYTMPVFLIGLFWAKDLGILSLIGKYVALLVMIILIKNTNPRLRIDQAMRFFWGPVTLIALAALILALLGI